MTPLFACLVGPILVTMPGWKSVSRRMEKRGAMIAASALFLIGSAALAATPAFGAPYAYGCAGLQMLQYSMLADTIVADVLVSGKRRAGMFTGIWTAAETVLFALGAFVLAALLALAGYVSSDLKHPVSRPQSALDALRWGAPLLAGAFIAAGIAATLRYDPGRRADGAPARHGGRAGTGPRGGLT